MLSFFPRGVLDEILNLIESVSEEFPSYFWSDACTETCIAANSDSEAHSGPCYEGLGPASEPLSVTPQRLGGCANTRTSIFSESPCAPVPADMHCARCVGLLGTPGLPRV